MPAINHEGWILSTELSQGDPINNPWTGVSQAGGPVVIEPISNYSNSSGRDIEIKIEWDNDNGTTSRRFYKGWPLNYVFDYTNATNGSVYLPSSDITVYAKWSEDGPWYSNSQRIFFAYEGVMSAFFSEGSGNMVSN